MTTEKELQEALERARQAALRVLHQGRVATYIPELGKADPNLFAMSVHLLDGTKASIGDTDRSFSMQSVSKVFSLAAAMHAKCEDLFAKVSVEPSGDAFHSIVLLEEEEGMPRNPFVNAGAIAISNRLPGTTAKARFEYLRRFLGDMCGEHPPEMDSNVWLSETNTGHRNRALAHFMQHWQVIEDADGTIDTYFRQCAISVTAKSLARYGLFLANKGVDPLTEKVVISAEENKMLLALMTTCGLYDAVGQFAVDVGLPAKSGVSGGILAIVPGEMSIAAFGPALDGKGNSVGGIAALQSLSNELGLSLFN